MGYDLTPYLPIVVEQKEKYLYNYDTGVSDQVRDDVAQVLSDLYAEHHLLPLRGWAHGLGLQLRVQGYGLETDSIYEAALFDQPEGESLGFKNLDDYRALSGGRDMGGRTILSCEAAAYANGAYNTTWNKVLQTLGSIYAGGVNQAVLHGFSYADAPGAAWPGFAAFSPYNGAVGYGEAWGPRQPMWRHAPDVAGHLRRTQFGLQSGVNRADLAWFRQKGWTATGIGVGWGTNAAIGLGWSYGFISAPLLSLDSARVVGRRAWRRTDPATRRSSSRATGSARTPRRCSSRARRQLDRLARAGLPVVFVGDWSNARATGLPQPGEDAEVRGLVADMLGLPNVRTVTRGRRPPGRLAALGVDSGRRARGVHPDACASFHSRVARRTRDPGRRRRLLPRQRPARGEPQDHPDRAGRVADADRRPGPCPFRLDTWTGEVEPIAVYEATGGRIKVRVALNPARVDGHRPGPARLRADRHQGRGRGRHRRRPGSLRRETSSWSRSAGPAPSSPSWPGAAPAARPSRRCPDPVPLSRWDLTLEDWQPGASPTETTVTQRQRDASSRWSRGRRCPGSRTSPASGATPPPSTSTPRGAGPAPTSSSARSSTPSGSS